LPEFSPPRVVTAKGVRFMTEDGREGLNAFAQYCGYDSPEAIAAEVTRLKRLGGLPCTWREASIAVTAVPQLIDESFHPIIKNNPREVTRQDLERMYAQLG
jgi:alcohol dehydrogenase class IV